MSFCAKARGLGASTPWQLLAQSLAPVLLSYAIAIQDTLLPPPSLSLSFHPIPCDAIPAQLKAVGCSSRIRVYVRVELLW